MKTWIVTGGTGFLGTRVLELASKNTELNFLVITRFPELHNRKLLTHSNLKYVAGDEQSIRILFANQRIDGVLHMATNYGRTHQDLQGVILINLRVPLLLLELAAKNESSHFINIDSFFNKRGYNYFTLPEYALTKKSLSLILPEYADRLEISNLVLEHVYGPNDSQEKFVPFLIQSILDDRVQSLDLTPGDQVRDFIYVKDAAQGIFQVLMKQPHEIGLHTYGLGTGIGTTVSEFVRTLIRLSGSDVKPNFGGIPYVQNEIMYSCADNGSLLELGWSSTFSISDGISEMLRKP
jgi:nucleoside-diphosphate-sugar epimerase